MKRYFIEYANDVTRTIKNSCKSKKTMNYFETKVEVVKVHVRHYGAGMVESMKELNKIHADVVEYEKIYTDTVESHKRTVEKYNAACDVKNKWDLNAMMDRFLKHCYIYTDDKILEMVLRDSIDQLWDIVAEKKKSAKKRRKKTVVINENDKMKAKIFFDNHKKEEHEHIDDEWRTFLFETKDITDKKRFIVSKHKKRNNSTTIGVFYDSGIWGETDRASNWRIWEDDGNLFVECNVNDPYDGVLCEIREITDDVEKILKSEDWHIDAEMKKTVFERYSKKVELSKYYDVYEDAEI